MSQPVDLRKLPQWLQYAIAVIVAGAVMALAWHVGRNRPIPTWTVYWVAACRWVGVPLLFLLIIRWLVRRNRQGGNR